MPLDEIEIKTERLTVRPVTEADLEGLMAINGDPEVTNFLPYATWESPEDASAWYQRMANFSRETGARQLVLVHTQQQLVIGTLLAFKFDEASRRAELGYVIGRSHWRQGFASEAVRALLVHLFGTQGLRRVEAEVNPENAASCALLKALGFTLEGHLRERYEAKGKIYGVNVYGLLASDWRVKGDVFILRK